MANEQAKHIGPSDNRRYVAVELYLDAQSRGTDGDVTGCVESATAGRREFAGWLGLLSELERELDDAALPSPPVPSEPDLPSAGF